MTSELETFNRDVIIGKLIKHIKYETTFWPSEWKQELQIRLSTQAVVWAGNEPFTGEQVLALLNENERLREAFKALEYEFEQYRIGKQAELDQCRKEKADLFAGLFK